MMNLTAFLLVLTLTGVPVAGVVCVAECPYGPATSVHCHRDTNDEPMMSASDRCNDPSISESPYVVEHRAAPGAAVLVTTLLPIPPALVRTDAPADPARAADGWLKPPPVLRL
jgi:hypothetical protein